MDANFFRFLVKDGLKFLKSARIEKIYNPVNKLWTFKLSSKVHLIFFYDAKDNFLFFSKNKPENPIKPSPEVSWWRKRVSNFWISDVSYDWSNRQLSLKTEHSSSDIRWILLDLRSGLNLLSKNPIEQRDITWPPLEEILTNRDIYKIYPHITSPLRYSLLKLKDVSKQKFWYSRLISGEIDKFYVYEGVKDKGLVLSLWPIEETEYEKELVFDSPLDAAEYYGWHVIDKQKNSGSSNKKKKRLEKRLKKEREKLEKWISLENKAQIIKENLHKIDPNAHLPNITFTMSDGTKLQIDLDPALSVKENMEYMFQRAKKGKKGLMSLLRREEQIDLSTGNINKSFHVLEPRSEKYIKNISLPARFAKLKVKVYKSSDGFLIVRGKNKEANHKLLSTGARAHDLWFHALSGPGAHVIVVRDNPKKEVPEATLKQAAIIAGLASYQKESDYAEVIGTEVRYVKKKKGMGLGEVDVTKVLYSYRIKLDSSIEEELRIF